MADFTLENLTALWVLATLLAPVASLLLLWGTKNARYRLEGWNNTGYVVPLFYVAALILLSIAVLLVFAPAVYYLKSHFSATFPSWQTVLYFLTGIGLCAAITFTGLQSFQLAGRLRQVPAEGEEINLEGMRTTWKITWLRSAAWGLIALPGILFLSIPLVIVLMICMPTYWIVGMIEAKKRGRKCHLLWHLALATQQNRSHVDALAAYATTSADNFSMEVASLAGSLKAGLSLSDALQAVPKLLPEQVVSSIRIAEETGTLSTTLPQLALRQTERLQAHGATNATFLSYFSGALILVAGLVGFLSTFIIPKFLAIFRDFGYQPPPGTYSIFGYGEGPQQSLFFLVAPFLAASVACFVVEYVSYRRDWRDINSPIMSALFPGRRTPDILRTISAGISQGCPLSDIFSTLARTYQQNESEIRIAEMATLADRGDNCWETLRKEKFINSREMQVLETAQKTGHLPWALNQLAITIEERYARRLQMTSEFVQPILIFTVGLVVAYVCLAVFLPIAEMTTKIL